MTREQDEEMTTRLLRLAGPRLVIPVERAERIRHAVSGEWRAELRRHHLRRRRRLLTGGIVLASAAALLIAVRLGTPRKIETSLTSGTTAIVERTEGPAKDLSTGQRLTIGEWIETSAGSRIALRIDRQTSMRLDVSSRARLLKAKTIELERGAVYVDTGLDSAALEVRTRFGVARDIGTQFEVRLSGDSLRVRVRTGLVELHRATGTTAVRGGNEVILAGNDAVTRQVPTFGPEWQWAAQLAPPFDIEGQPLATFLEHISREQGWTLRFSDAELSRSARKIELHGSVNGLQPEDAVTVAVRTSNLSYRLQNGELVVSRPKGQN